MSLAHDLAFRLLGRLTKKGSFVLPAFISLAFAGTLIVITLGILKGFQTAYRNAILNFNSHVSLLQNGGFDEEGTLEVTQILEKANRLFPLQYSPYTFFETLMPSREGLRPIIFKAVKNPDHFYHFPFHKWKNRDSIYSFAGKNILDLQAGALKAKKLSILTYNRFAEDPEVRSTYVPLAGFFASGLYPFDSTFVLMNWKDFRKKFPEETGVQGFEIRLQDLDQLDELIEFLRLELKPDMDISRWDELNASLLEALKLERVTVMILASIVLLTACLNVFGFCFLLLYARRDDFMLLIWLGISPRHLTRILVFAALRVTALATGLAFVVGGVVLAYLKYGPGWSLDPDVYYVSRLPADFDGVWFLGFGVLSLLLSAWAARIVAWRIGQGLGLTSSVRMGG